MGPKKRQAGTSPAKKKRRGLLGVSTGYNSESDEDYDPHASRTKRGQQVPASSDSDLDSEAPTDSDDSHSGETLAARQQRLAGQVQNTPSTKQRRNTRAGAAASDRKRGKQQRQQQHQQHETQARSAGTNRHRRTSAAAPPPSGWDSLPTAVLAQIFQAVCAAGALPMAPRLACVCTNWASAVADTPELWHVLDTAHLLSTSRKHLSCGTSSPTKSPNNKSNGRKGKAGTTSKAAAQPLVCSIEAGLRSWVASGRLQQLRELHVCGQGSSRLSPAQPEVAGAAASYDPDAASDDGVELSAELLMQIAEHCQQLKRMTISGAPGWRAEELAGALLAMPSLAELRLSGVRLATVSGLDTCLRSVLDCAALTGVPNLTHLVVRDCPLLGHKALRALCVPPQRPAAASIAGADGPSSPGSSHGLLQHDQQQHDSAELLQPQVPHALHQLGPAFPNLQVLDLSLSGAAAMGRPAELLLDGLQAAMPNLRVLKLSGLGGLSGWLVKVRKDATALPGFPKLRALHIGCSVTQPLNGSLRLSMGMSYIDDSALLNLAGKSLLLEELDLSACQVSPKGFRQLAEAVAAQQAATAQLQEAADSLTAAPAAAAAEDRDAAGTAEESAGAEDAVPENALPLKRLQLNGSGLASDEGLVLVGQCCSDSLEQLVVRGAGRAVGDVGIRGLRGCCHLASLDITGSSVTEAGLRDLLSALPAGVLDELHVDSCRSLSRGARQAAAAGVPQLQHYLQQNE